MKLLDEKGLTTVWAAIKNTFLAKSDASSYAKKSEAATHTSAGVMTPSDKIKLDGIAENANNYSLPLAATSTRGGIQLGYSQNGRNYPVQLSGEKAYVNVPWTDTNTTYDLSSYSQKDETVKNIYSSILGTSTSGYKQLLEIDYANGTTKNVEILNASGGLDGFMSASDKSKLDNIASGANNYTLPIASKNTLGGIKSTTQEFSENFDWPIYVAQDGKAFTYIPGLYVNVNGSIKDIKVNNQSKKTSAIYNSEGIIRQTSNGYTTIGLPAKDGTLALTSDISSIIFDHATDGSIYSIGYGGMHQVDLLEESGRYDVSDWFNHGEKGSVLDIYCLITVNDARIFINNVSLLLNGNDCNLISVANKHIRLINCENYILVAEYNTNETAG